MLRRCRALKYSTGLPPNLQEQLFVEPMSTVEAGRAQAMAEDGCEAQMVVRPAGPYVMPGLVPRGQHERAGNEGRRP